MRNFKKLMAALMAVAMLASLCVTASAADASVGPEASTGIVQSTDINATGGKEPAPSAPTFAVTLPTDAMAANLVFHPDPEGIVEASEGARFTSDNSSTTVSDAAGKLFFVNHDDSGVTGVSGSSDKFTIRNQNLTPARIVVKAAREGFAESTKMSTTKDFTDGKGVIANQTAQLFMQINSKVGTADATALTVGSDGVVMDFQLNGAPAAAYTLAATSSGYTYTRNTTDVALDADTIPAADFWMNGTANAKADWSSYAAGSTIKLTFYVQEGNEVVNADTKVPVATEKNITYSYTLKNTTKTYSDLKVNFDLKDFPTITAVDELAIDGTAVSLTSNKEYTASVTTGKTAALTLSGSKLLGATGTAFASDTALATHTVSITWDNGKTSTFVISAAST